MTTTTSITLTNAYTMLADSDSVTAVTIHNRSDSRIEVYIDDSQPQQTTRGVYIRPDDERLYSGFSGKIFVRGKSNYPQTIVVIAS